MRAGQIVYGGDEAADSDLLIVRSGRLRCFTSFEGKELTLYMLEAGDAIYLPRWRHAGSAHRRRRGPRLASRFFRQLVLAEPELALAVLPASTGWRRSRSA
jgi:hypothetical protein